MSENVKKYNEAEVVAYYEQLTGLQPCEEYMFRQHLREGMDILDMGVGGGRTTPYLSRLAGSYVGADYSEGMVVACKKAWPEKDFRHCDATDMREFASASMDAVVFSFNGIDYIPSDAGRARALSEISRVLRPGGVFIFSSHNARQLAIWPVLANARPHQVVWRVLRSVFKSLGIAARSLTSGAYAIGQGYLRDPDLGGFDIYTSTPRTMVPQLNAVGLEVVEIVGGHYPVVSCETLTPWFYYSCVKK
jgi:SAM-dependent methyltransferase